MAVSPPDAVDGSCTSNLYHKAASVTTASTSITKYMILFCAILVPPFLPDSRPAHPRGRNTHYDSTLFPICQHFFAENQRERYFFSSFSTIALCI